MLAVFAPLKTDRLCLFGFKNKRWILYSYKIPTVRKKETLISDQSASNLEALEKLENKYDSHFDYIATGAIVRSRATWYEQGEKNNKYFLGLESNREGRAVFAGCLQAKVVLFRTKRISWQKLKTFTLTYMPLMMKRKSLILLFFRHQEFRN